MSMLFLVRMFFVWPKNSVSSCILPCATPPLVVLSVSHTCPLHTNTSEYEKREAHQNWSMVTPVKRQHPWPGPADSRQ